MRLEAARSWELTPLPVLSVHHLTRSTVRGKLMLADVSRACGVQLQYPGSLPTMMTDLRHIRVFGAFLSKTEIKFDLVSAVDELAGQVALSGAEHCAGSGQHCVPASGAVPGNVHVWVFVMLPSKICYSGWPSRQANAAGAGGDVKCTCKCSWIRWDGRCRELSCYAELSRNVCATHAQLP